MTERPVCLVTGGAGQLGFELVRELQQVGDVIAPPRSDLDLSKPKTIREEVRRLKPALIVNAAAYTAVDKAESERGLCFAINEEGPAALAEEAKAIGAALIHYSTDYVFDGAKTAPYTETDEANPLNVYGESKLAGERAIEAVGGSWVIVRTSWVYGLRRENFLRTMLRLARERTELRVVSDQFGAPTWTSAIAQATKSLVSLAGVEGIGPRTGIYHLSAGGMTSWFDFARAILSQDPGREKHRCARVIPIPTTEYPTPAKRPRWSVLDNGKLYRTFGVTLPSWQDQLSLALPGS